MGKPKKKRRGRPARPGGRDPAVAVRLPPAIIEQLDRWGAAQPEPTSSRSEAIRRLVELGLQAKPKKAKPK